MVMISDSLNDLLIAKNVYASKLMPTLEKACRENFELTVKAGCFVVEDRDDRDGDCYCLPIDLTNSAELDVLEELEFQISQKIKNREEIERRIRVKNEALAKLTAEEREVLGLVK